jgi:hypothetical protein
MRTSLTCSHIASRVASRKSSLRLSFSMQWSRSRLCIGAHTWSRGGGLLQGRRAEEDGSWAQNENKKRHDFLIAEGVALAEWAPGINGNFNFLRGWKDTSRGNVCWTTDWEMGLSSLSKANIL